MILDVRTVHACTMVLTALFGVVLLLYRRRFHTYPGFGSWTMAAFAASLAHLSLMTRGSYPLEISIFTVNTAITAELLLRYRGARAFMRGATLAWPWFLLPVAVGVTTLLFPRGEERAFLRAIPVTLVCGPLLFLTGREFLRRVEHTDSALCKPIGWALFFVPSLMVLRMILWARVPDSHMLDATIQQIVLQLAIMAVEMGISVGFLTMNNQRLERELASAKQEVRTLGGMLPMCASCKKIRDDEGYWQGVEAYIAERTEATFTHGLCPVCVDKLYEDAGMKPPKDRDRSD